MKKRNDTLRRTPLKLAAYLLLLASLIAAAAGGVGVALALNYDLYTAQELESAGSDYTQTARWQSMLAYRVDQLQQISERIQELAEHGVDPSFIDFENGYLSETTADGREFDSAIAEREIVVGQTGWTVAEYVDNMILWPYLNLDWVNTNFRFYMTVDYAGEREIVSEDYLAELPDQTQDIWRSTVQNSAENRFSGTLILKTPGLGQTFARYDEGARSLHTQDGVSLWYGVDTTFPAGDGFSIYAEAATTLYAYRYVFIELLAAGAALALLAFLYLLCVCGKRPGTDEIVLAPLDRAPGDLTLVVLLTAASCGLALGLESLGIRGSGWWENMFHILGVSALGGAAWLCCLTLLSLVTRVRAHTLVQNNLITRFGRKIWNALRWVGRQIGRVWGLFREHGLEYIRAGGAARIGLAVVLLALAGTCLLGAFLGLLWGSAEVIAFGILLGVLWGVAVLVALGQMVKLDEGARELAAGNLTHKIETGKLYIGFKEHAEHLNAIADGMNAAVENRMKSERLKTELLTNVSHDIKTPLTSIINYVDLLRGCEIADERAQEYLDVLDRQSKRLKKLLEDLLEASKASTGNIRAVIVPTDAGELLRQAAGEYEERLLAAKVTPVLSIPEGPATVMADGRLLWRIFDNMLNNIVKYSMPGTRAYLSVEPHGAGWRITFKNISREPLNIAADELMERFVRGDASRTTEGNGLGLSIARSLAECMNAEFELSIDGDLFRASVIL